MRSKKILILSCLGGYGHVAASKTLIHHLGKDYEIDIANPIRELKIWKFPAGESLYNFLIGNNWTRLTNFVVRYIAPPLFRRRNEKTAKLVEKHIREKGSDIVISVIPFVNAGAYEAAKKFGIPFLIVTTDNDLENWVYWLEQEANSQMKITIGNDLPTSKEILLKKQFSKNSIETIGLPLRPEFLDIKPKEALKEIYAVPENKQVVLIMMGGVGARCIYEYVKTIAGSSLNIHLMVCTGRNKRLATKLRKVRPATGNSIDIIPFTEKVHELFALSDLILTKPGPGTINEARSLKLPILIDRTRMPLFWEQANIDLVERYQIGACVRSYVEAPKLIHQFLNDEQTRETVIRAFEEIPFNQFATRISTLVEEMTREPALGETIVTSQNITYP